MTTSAEVVRPWWRRRKLLPAAPVIVSCSNEDALAALREVDSYFQLAESYRMGDGMYAGMASVNVTTGVMAAYFGAKAAVRSVLERSAS